MQLLRKALTDGSFLLDLDERDMASILRRALDFVVARGLLPAERRDEVETLLLEREQLSQSPSNLNYTGSTARDNQGGCQNAGESDKGRAQNSSVC
jgi:hypothetical protein